MSLGNDNSIIIDHSSTTIRLLCCVLKEVFHFSILARLCSISLLSIAIPAYFYSLSRKDDVPHCRVDVTVVLVAGATS